MFGTVSDANNDLPDDRVDLLSMVQNNQSGLKSLRDDHLEILSNISEQKTNVENKDIEERINAVTESLQLLEVGVAESGVMLSLAAHFERMESEKTLTKMEMRRVKVNQMSCYKINI